MVVVSGLLVNFKPYYTLTSRPVFGEAIRKLMRNTTSTWNKGEGGFEAVLYDTACYIVQGINRHFNKQRKAYQKIETNTTVYKVCVHRRGCSNGNTFKLTCNPA
jgi:hypothetical protein